MKELDEKSCGKYCICCGKKNKHIWLFLSKAKVINVPGSLGRSYREWRGHKAWENNDYFYTESCNLDYCTECGNELDDEDVITVNESRGEFWGAPCSETIVTGYHCSHCGYKEDI